VIVLHADMDCSQESCWTVTVYITKTEMSLSPPPLQIQVVPNFSMKPRAMRKAFSISVDILFYHKFLTVYSSCVHNIS
jgi:hypothetical protein